MLKTYKLYLGGQFPRTESGRSYLVSAADGAPLANACRASRKDVRDAVRFARGAAAGWAARTAMNRGQILYRVAELMEGRFDQFTAEVAAAEGIPVAAARTAVGRSIDRWVWYAGWADKIAQVLGSANPVGAPYFTFTVPEPSGVVGLVAPERSSLLGLVSRLGPALAGGNVAVVLASEARPLPAITLAEVLATSDVPGGVVNILTGYRKELVPVAGGARGRRRARRVRDPRRPAGRGRGRGRRLREADRPTAPRDDGCRVRLARRPRHGAPRVDRGLPRDEDRLAPDRGVIVVAGEALVDVIARRNGEIDAVPGGGPYNTARAIGRLGVPVAWAGVLSTDAHGRAMAEALAADGVSLDLVQRTGCRPPRHSPSSTIGARRGTGSCVDDTSAPSLDGARLLASLPPVVDAVHVGTLGLVFEPMAGALEALVASLGPDVLLMVDPNCRPSAITDPAAYRARMARILARADIVKLSTADQAYLGFEIAAPVVVVTDAGGPVRVRVGGEALEVPVPAVEVVDTVGAGDTFGGAMLAWLVDAGITRATVADPEVVLRAVGLGSAPHRWWSNALAPTRRPSPSSAAGRALRGDTPSARL